MTKADPEFICLCIYQWSGERGQNILDKATFSEAELKNWENHLEKLEEGKQTRCGYSIQGVNARRYGTN